MQVLLLKTKKDKKIIGPEDLLNKQFITRSRWSYSPRVVCVRKKDRTLRLCVDYRESNRRTVPDRHPIPRIQETLDSLIRAQFVV